MAFQHELNIAKELAIKAGAVIMTYFNKKQNIKTKEDGSSVTDADFASNKIIIAGLQKHFPKDGIVSEESEAIAGERKWYVDPLDGTRSFIEGIDHFAVHIGLCIKGVPVAGVVYRPSTKEMYYGDSQGAFKETAGKNKVALKATDDEKHMVLISTLLVHESASLKTVLDGIKVTDIVRASCTGLRMMLIAENKGDLLVTSAVKARSWDFCAPHAVLKFANAHFSYLDGDEINYDSYVPSEKLIIGTKSERKFREISAKIRQ